MTTIDLNAPTGLVCIFSSCKIPTQGPPNILDIALVTQAQSTHNNVLEAQHRTRGISRTLHFVVKASRHVATAGPDAVSIAICQSVALVSGSIMPYTIYKVAHGAGNLNMRDLNLVFMNAMCAGARDDRYVYQPYADRADSASCLWFEIHQLQPLSLFNVSLFL